MNQNLPRTLFVGISNGAVAWYRCALPAITLGCDWVGFRGEPGPGKGLIRTGMIPADFTIEDAAGYEVVVVQQVGGRAWLQAIRDWQAAGVTVLYEIDDWLHGVRKLRHHVHAERLDRATVESYELCMRAADGVICSTEWLARRYRSVNPRTWVCRNAIDLKRFEFTRPRRDHVGIGWSGGTGHTEAAKPWVAELAGVMREHPQTRFTSVGQDFADWLAPEFGPRTLSIPFTAMEVYPAALTHFDIALAPAGRQDYFKGKSDLRWLEAAAMSLPCIADPEVYPDIEHGVTGFHAATPAEMREIVVELIADRDLRERVGAAARAHVVAERSFPGSAVQWAEVLREFAHVPAAA
jgi:hypothetical protein